VNRSDTFLARGRDGDAGPDLEATLTPFDNLVAFVIGKELHIVVCNAGAKRAYAAKIGAPLAALHLPGDAREVLAGGLSGIFDGEGAPLRLLHLDSPAKAGPALFQIRKVMGADQQDTSIALIIITQYHWQVVIGNILEEIFKLTAAEQGVVRGLVEGLDAKAVAVECGTSEGTVRGQIKSLMSKMNARSQSEVIHPVLSLRDTSEGSHASTALPHTAPLRVTEDWYRRRSGNLSKP